MRALKESDCEYCPLCNPAHMHIADAHKTSCSETERNGPHSRHAVLKNPQDLKGMANMHLCWSCGAPSNDLSPPGPHAEKEDTSRRMLPQVFNHCRVTEDRTALLASCSLTSSRSLPCNSMESPSKYPLKKSLVEAYIIFALILAVSGALQVHLA